MRLTSAHSLTLFAASGCGAVYTANILNALPDSELVKSYPKQGVFNPAGNKLIAGQRLLPGLVTRAVDANRVRIQQEIKMTGVRLSLSQLSLILITLPTVLPDPRLCW